MSGTQYFVDSFNGTEPLEGIQIAEYLPPFFNVELTSAAPLDVPEDPTFVEFVNGTEVGSVVFGESDPDASVYNSTTGQYDTNFIAVGAQVEGEFDAYPCFATGTLISTPHGKVAVEDLEPGNTVTLARGGTAKVIWLGHRRQHHGLVICVRAHALGHRMPVRNLIVSADHGLFVDGVLVQAGLLANGETIVAERRDVVAFWHVELEQHGILLAEGVPAESYLDTGNRRQFANCALAYDPAATWGARCADMVFGGERLEAIKRQLPAMA